VHPCGVAELLVDPLPAGAKREGALYPDGAHIKDLKQVRDIIYKMQRPAIAPQVILSPVLYEDFTIEPLFFDSSSTPMTGARKIWSFFITAGFCTV
jgi:hypothetical protein